MQTASTEYLLELACKYREALALIANSQGDARTIAANYTAGTPSTQVLRTALETVKAGCTLPVVLPNDGPGVPAGWMTCPACKGIGSSPGVAIHKANRCGLCGGERIVPEGEGLRWLECRTADKSRELREWYESGAAMNPPKTAAELREDVPQAKPANYDAVAAKIAAGGRRTDGRIPERGAKHGLI